MRRAIALTVCLTMLPIQLRARSSAPFDVTLVRVATGSRIDVKLNGEDACIVLAGIESPSYGHDGFDEARRALSELLEGKKLTVYVEPRSPLSGDDRCVVAQVVFEDEGRPLKAASLDARNASIRMLADGWARIQNTSVPSAIRERLQAAQDEAIRHRLGLWGK